MASQSQSGPTGGRIVEGSLETLKLMALLVVAVLLMIGDRRGGWLEQVREGAETMLDPVYRTVGLPGRLADAARETLVTRASLMADNRRMTEELLVLRARSERLESLLHENRRLRELLGGTRGLQVEARLVGLLDVDLDPFRHQVMLDHGSALGLAPGQALIDGGGVFGQVVRTSEHHATALLVTDPDHAVPVQVVRSGLRLLAFGTGDRDRLELRNIPRSGDIQVGDDLVTSGIGGTFPAGFRVGSVMALDDDPIRQFRIGQVRPAAALDRSGEVLAIWTRTVDFEPAGPPLPPPQPAPDALRPNAPSEPPTQTVSGPEMRP
ncbi:MAG TPA: rod shape-determining protein MreC [Xanthomonadales bacterium]|nr:rod shape-determining protein MreC [Xanthomonadales bacterium]